MLLGEGSLSFRQIDIFSFDESFFVKLAAIVSSITLATVNLFTKYLNKIIIVIKEIIIDGVIINLHNLVICSGLLLVWGL